MPLIMPEAKRTVNDRTHGVQFRADFLRSAPPTTAEGIEKYLAHHAYRIRRDEPDEGEEEEEDEDFFKEATVWVEGVDRIHKQRGISLCVDLSAGLGVWAVWPTAGLNETGDGKYRIGPVVGVRLSLPEISPGSFFLPQVIYLNSVASRNENKGHFDGLSASASGRHRCRRPASTPQHRWSDRRRRTPVRR